MTEFGPRYPQRFIAVGRDPGDYGPEFQKFIDDVCAQATVTNLVIQTLNITQDDQGEIDLGGSDSSEEFAWFLRGI